MSGLRNPYGLDRCRRQWATTARALLARNGNNIRIVIYTNDDKGSYDPEMTSQRLAGIRTGEEEEACRIVGISRANSLAAVS